MNTQPSVYALLLLKRAARISLGTVWLYEGLVPKMMFVSANPEQTALVVRSGIYYPTPEATLVMLGMMQAIVGIVLIIGWAERAMVVIATAGMLILMVLVALNKPNMLIDPFGALVKDLCLIVCAYVVWVLGRETATSDASSSCLVA